MDDFIRAPGAAGPNGRVREGPREQGVGAPLWHLYPGSGAAPGALDRRAHLPEYGSAPHQVGLWRLCPHPPTTLSCPLPPAVQHLPLARGPPPAAPAHPAEGGGGAGHPEDPPGGTAAPRAWAGAGAELPGRPDPAGPGVGETHPTTQEAWGAPGAPPRRRGAGEGAMLALRHTAPPPGGGGASLSLSLLICEMGWLGGRGEPRMS